jgi:hypothetical protein
MSNANLLQKPVIKSICEFNVINAAIDISTGEMWISDKINNPDKLTNIMNDEIAHLNSGSADHDGKWKDFCQSEYGKIPEHNPEFDLLKRRLGIDKNIGGNIGNITGLQGLLLDYHLIQSYRKFSQRILATEGRWEVKGNNKIRLFPIPRGTYPVFVEYMPCIDEFRSPWARELTKRAAIAEAAIILGNIRSKRALPTPDGSSTTFNGETLLAWGREEKKEIIKEAIDNTEPPGIYAY